MKRVSIFAATAASLFMLAAPAAAQTVGTIVVAHGGSAEWNAPVLRIAQDARTGGPVEVALLMGEFAPQHRFQDAVARLVERGAERIVVVPLLASSHSGHYDQIRYLAGDSVTLDERMMHHLHMAGIERASSPVPVRVTRAMDDSAQVARVIADRALRGRAAPPAPGHGAVDRGAHRTTALTGMPPVTPPGGRALRP